MISRKRHPRWHRVWVGLAASLSTTTLLAGTSAAPAASAAGVVVIPKPLANRGLSYFKLQLVPGSPRRAGAIELRNPTSRRVLVALAPVEGETLSTLGSSYGTPKARPGGAARWVVLAATRLSLSAHQTAVVPLAVTVAPGTPSGDYLGGVSVEQLDQHSAVASSGRVSIASVARYAIGVEVQVPGPRHPLLKFTEAQAQRQPAGLTFLLSARNAGNVILQGVHGAVSIKQGGNTVVSRRIEAGTFVSGTSIAYPVTAFSQHPHEGTRYRVSAWLRYPGGIARLDTPVTFGHRDTVIQRRYDKQPAATGSGMAWWKIAGVIAVALYALATTALLLRRRGRGVIAAPDEGA